MTTTTTTTTIQPTTYGSYRADIDYIYTASCWGAYVYQDGRIVGECDHMHQNADTAARCANRIAAAWFRDSEAEAEAQREWEAARAAYYRQRWADMLGVEPAEIN